MRRFVNGGLIVASAALLIGYALAFIARWGVRGLIAAAIFGAALAVAYFASTADALTRWPRLIAALAYALLAGFGVAFLLDAFKNEIIAYLLVTQAATGVIGLIACAWPRPQW